MTREEAIAFFKDMNECTYGNLEAVEMAIKALEQESKWIPVIERLPKKFGTYIVTANDGHMYRTSFAKYQSKLRSWILTGHMSHWRVVAWQSLPEPYKVESEEDISKMGIVKEEENEEIEEYKEVTLEELLALKDKASWSGDTEDDEYQIYHVLPDYKPIKIKKSIVLEYLEKKDKENKNG